MAIVTFLIIGWILSWFKFNKLFIQAFKELFELEITNASYSIILFSLLTFREIKRVDQPDVSFDGIRYFVDQVIPVLQKRGLFHEDYEETTLRDHMGVSYQYGLSNGK
jgi:hypothetical protein